MTSSAPMERTKSIFAVLLTPVTCMPSDFAIWMANGPTLPDAPFMRNRSPARGAWPAVTPCNARIPACGKQAACSGDIEAGLPRNAFSEAQTYSAREPAPYENRSAKTSSPGRRRVTAGPTASTRPATSTPSRRFRGRRTPATMRSGAGRPYR